MPKSLHPSLPVPTRLARSIRLALGAATMLGLGQHALAQEDTNKLTRVEITGTSIKRLDAETALPVQVISRDDIVKSGATTAEQLLSQLSANVGSIDEKQQNTDTQRNSGFSGANLRGIGVSSTLVLLNGRRMANYAFGGQGVDLGAIPMAALQRVEVLKDGASAIYGADAVGGVINFITRRDYQGAELSARLGGYEDGGGNRKSFSGAFGVGSLVNDGFNVFASLQYQTSAQLRAVQREWSRTAVRPDVGSVGSSTTNFPQNIFGSSSSGSILGSVSTNNGQCNPPLSVFAEGMCQFDYQAAADLVPESKKLNALARGVLQLAPEHQLFAELAHAKNEAAYRISPALISSYRAVSGGPVINLTYPKGGPFYPTSYVDAKTGKTMPTSGNALPVRVRLTPLGQRERNQETTQDRVVIGAEGTLVGWDYNTAINHSVVDTVEHYNNGFVYSNKIGPLIASGAVNLWGDISADVMAKLEDTQARNVVGRLGRATADSFDARVSREIYELPAGPVGFAAGIELRREKLSDRRGEEVKTGLVNNVTSSPDTVSSRNVKAVFAEVQVPLAPQLDLNLAVRHDSYSGSIGSSTNPKLSLRWQPVKGYVLRGAAGTGFRAPSLADQSATGSPSTTSSFYPDPERCINGVGPGCKPGPIPTRSGGNPFLKPETSRQFSLGAAIEPGMGLLATVDYWDIRKKDVISQLNEGLIGSNFSAIRKFVTRSAVDPVYPTLPGEIFEILLPVDNQGQRNVAGIDLSVVQRAKLGEFGQLRTSLNGTYLTKSEEQLLPGGEITDTLGKYANLYATPRWKHHLSLDWSLGHYGVTVANKFQLHYRDAFASIPNPTTGFVSSVAHGTAGSVSNNVASSSTWDLLLGYTGIPQLRLTFGVINLFNKAPPTSNQAQYFRGFDQGVDATGRYAYVSATYRLK